MFIKLEKNHETSLYEQLYREIKAQILNDELTNHEKLPSKRELKIDLDISMTTVERAYDQLLDEDLIYSVEKSGYYVSEIDQLKTISKEIPHIEKPVSQSSQLPLGTIDTSIVQQDVIKQISREVFDNAELLNHGESNGDYALRKAVLEHLHFNRGVSCSIDQVFLGPSTEYLLQQALFLLDYPKMTIEDPGYPVIKKVLSHLKLPSDIAQVNDDGIDLNEVKQNHNNVIHITPSHQFPGGTVLSLQKRVRLLNYAAEQDAYIIEDDYDSEFRYTGKPLPSLQGMDQNDRTIYMSTFSKSLYPSLRLSVMVLPETLAEKYYRNDLSCNIPRQMQHIVAKYIDEGYLNRHINRVRKIYGRKMGEITSWLKIYHPSVNIKGEHTGMHFILQIPDTDIRETAGIHRLIPLSHYSQHAESTDSIVVGIGEKKSSEITRILDNFLKECLI